MGRGDRGVDAARSSFSSRRCRPGPSGGTPRPSPRARLPQSPSSTPIVDPAAAQRHRDLGRRNYGIDGVRRRRAGPRRRARGASTSPSTSASACRRSRWRSAAMPARGPTRRHSTAGSTTTGAGDVPRRTAAPRRCGCSVSASRCLFLGGLAVDLWRGIATRRELSAMADASRPRRRTASTSVALRHGTVQLDPARVRAIANETLARDDRVGGPAVDRGRGRGDEVAVDARGRSPVLPARHLRTRRAVHRPRHRNRTPRAPPVSRRGATVTNSDHMDVEPGGTWDRIACDVMWRDDGWPRGSDAVTVSRSVSAVLATRSHASTQVSTKRSSSMPRGGPLNVDLLRRVREQ